MCGRYAVTVGPAELAAELGAVDEVTLPRRRDPGGDTAEAVPRRGGLAAAVGASGPNFNVAPTSPVLVVVDRHDDDIDGAVVRRVRAMRWGLVPHWAKAVGPGPVLFNARAETVAQKASFRSAFAAKRALVPMDGWFEWTQREDGRGRTAKQPYYLTPRDGGRLFAAGLWSVWHPPGAGGQGAPPLLSCTILTTDAVGPLRQVHDRMPLLLARRDWDRWLDPDLPGPAELLAPPTAEVAGGIEVRRVGPAVNNVRNNGPDLVAPQREWAQGQGDATLF